LNHAAAEDPDLSVYLDEEVARQKKHERDVRVNTGWFPTFRSLGFVLLLVAVYLHDRIVPGQAGDAFFWRLALGYALYCGITWATLRAFYGEFPILGPIFLTTDIIAWTVAVYASGGDQSWLFLLLVLRPADQTAAGLRRVLWFALVDVLCYAGLLGWLSLVEQRPLNWPVELMKLAFLTLVTLYMVVPTQAADYLRQKNTEAVRVARRLIAQLADRTGQLEVALDRAETASRARNDFLRNVTHELRTPLNGIIGMTDLVLDSDIPSDHRLYLETVRTSGDDLLRLITDLLEFSSIESARIELKPASICVRALIASVLQTCRSQAESKGLEIGAEVHETVPDSLIADPVRLHHILLHLTENAVKFTHSGRVKLQVSVESGDSEQVVLRFEVEDTGIGITTEQQKTIFDAFSQGDASITRAYEGCGLGLTIASRLVHLMGGRLWVDSQPGNGSRFLFTLPFAVKASPDARAASA